MRGVREERFWPGTPIGPCGAVLLSVLILSAGCAVRAFRTASPEAGAKAVEAGVTGARRPKDDRCRAMIPVVLAHAADYEKRDFAHFQENAKAWRALPVKPPLSPEADRFRVLAENAFQNKDLAKAVGYYGHGLAVQPVWPEGHFNAANLYKEVGWRWHAVYHMKRYLELCPDAEDAKASREQMWLWEEEAKNSLAFEKISSQPRYNFMGLVARPDRPGEKGFVIAEVVPRSPAAVAGLKEGDAIIGCNGMAVAGGADLPRVVRQLPSDTRATVKFIRDGEEKTVKVQLVAIPDGAFEAFP